ncbi:MAG: putative membrane protein [Vicingaceae bacterium]|jgi:uncharacterized membrane protein
MFMKKTKLAIVAGVIAIAGASCTISHTAIVTNNAVGSKTGVAKGHTMQKDIDISYEAAMKQGEISTIGISEFKVKMFFIPIYLLTVTGE